MEKLLELQFLDILPTRSGFLFVRREILDETQIRLSFHEFLLHTREEVPVRRSVYLRRKFGAGYETLVRSLGDYVSCDTARLPDGNLAVLYPGGELGFFSKEGRPVWRGELTYRGAGVSDLAVDGDFFWSAVPEQNAVICFSTATKRIALRISGGSARLTGRVRLCGMDGCCMYVMSVRTKLAHLASTGMRCGIISTFRSLFINFFVGKRRKLPF